MQPPLIVSVQWLDSVVFSGWVHLDPDLHVPRVITSAGFLVADTDQFLILATSFDAFPVDDGHYGNLTVIPRASVQAISALDSPPPVP